MLYPLSSPLERTTPTRAPKGEHLINFEREREREKKKDVSNTSNIS
jgi:hypothetical protein